MSKRKPKRKTPDAEREEEVQLSRKRERRYDYEDLPTHESHGLIGISRIQGRANLHGSPIESHGFIELRISGGSRRAGLGGEHYMDEEIIAHVWMSEVQFAQMITTPNMGCGVPCTLRYYRDGDKLKECEDPPKEETVASVTRRHFKEDIDDAMATMKAVKRRIAKLLDEAKMAKTRRKAIEDEIFNLMRLFEDSAPFVMERFDENCQEAAATAKSEVASFVALVAQQHGLAALKEGAELRPLIEEQSTEDEDGEGT